MPQQVEDLNIKFIYDDKSKLSFVNMLELRLTLNQSELLQANTIFYHSPPCLLVMNDGKEPLAESIRL